MRAYDETILFLEYGFQKIEEQLPKPEIVDFGKRTVLRYREHLTEIAVLQKLARYVSGLSAAKILLYQGFTQELCVIFRTLDEFFEDLMFLALAHGSGNSSKLLSKYLEEFFQEEFDDPESAFRSTQKRDRLSRRDIHAALVKFGKENLNPSDAQQNHRTMSQAYSGYVHGSSVHIIEMVGGEKREYFLRGMKGTPRQQALGQDLWNYAYRGIEALLVAAKTAGIEPLVSECYEFRDYFENMTKRTGQGDAKDLVRKMKKV